MRANEFISEAHHSILKTVTIGPWSVQIDTHAVASMASRGVSPSDFSDIVNYACKSPDTLNTIPIIVIHDFKTNNPELGYDSYNGNDFCFDWIENHIKKIYPNGFDYYYNTEAVGAKRGLIYITPKI